MLLKFTTKNVPLCTPNCTPERWFQTISYECKKNEIPCKSID